MINEQKIPCPVCSTQIPFEVSALLKGVKFACPNCQAMIGMAPESMDMAKNAIEQYEQLKLVTKQKG